MIALHSLGADIDTIKSFMRHYQESKLEIPSNELLKEAECDWHSIDSYLGKRNNFYGIFKMMQKDLDSVYDHDIHHLVRTRFPLGFVYTHSYTIYNKEIQIHTVSSGISGAAFHVLIHLGYGLSINNEQLILEGMAYSTHSFLPFRYCPSTNDDELAKSEKVQSVLELLALVKKEDMLRKCVMDNSQNKDILDKVPGAFQRGMICLSIYGQEQISNYTQMVMDKIPKIKCENDLCALKKWLLSTVITLYAFGDGMDKNDFFLIHGVTAAWSLMEIIKFLKVDDANRAIIHFVNAVIALFVVQGAPEIESNARRNCNAEDLRYEIGKIVIGVMDEAKNEKFRDEHVYKLIQVVLECLVQEIVDESCAYYAIRKSLNPLQFASINSEFFGAGRVIPGSK